MFYHAFYVDESDERVMVADSEGDLAFVETNAAAFASEHGVEVTIEQSTNGIAWEAVV